MQRRHDLPTHPDDIKKPRKKHAKQLKNPHRRRAKPKNYVSDDPWLENKQVWKALSFVRAMINEDEPVPIGLAIYKAAKYYKVTQKEVAQASQSLAISYRRARGHFKEKK